MDENSKQLSRKWLDRARQTLLDAQFLRSQGGSDQSVINRAYYAMFYATLALLQEIGQAPKRHKGVLSLFDKEFVHTEKFDIRLSENFHRAFRLRQAGDYELNREPTVAEAVKCLNDAAEFVSEIEAYVKAKGYFE